MSAIEQRRRLTALLAAALSALLLAIDHWVGPDISFAGYYLIPIFLAAWSVGPRVGFILSAAVAAARFAIDLGQMAGFRHAATPYLNLVLRAVIFVVVVKLAHRFRHVLEYEKRLARVDELTGLFNRRAFFEVARVEINRSRRYRRPFTVAFMDIDHFKMVNDRYGHDAGDHLLRLAASAIQSSLRGTDVVARLGGDEFAFLLPESSHQVAEVVMEKVHAALKRVAEPYAWPVSFSIGAVTFLKAPASVDEIIKRADRLMYAAKRNRDRQIRYEVAGEAARSGV